MATTEIRVKVMAAEDLKKDGRFRKMSVYSVVWIDPALKQSTRVHRKGDRSPKWNDELMFGWRGDVLIFPHSTITIQVLRQRKRKHNKLLGTTYLPLAEIARIKALHDNPQDYNIVQLQLTTPSGHVQGYIILSIGLIDRSPPTRAPSAEPVMGYPVGLPPDMAYYSTFQFQSTSHAAHQQRSQASNTGSDFPVSTQPAGAVLYYPRSQEKSSPHIHTPQPYNPSVVQRRPRQRRGNAALALLGGAIGRLLLGHFVF